MRLLVAHTWDGVAAPADEQVTLALSWDDDALCIDVSAPLHGDPPPAVPPGPTPGLWEHEVVELFAVGQDGRYTEIELGPYGHHLVLRLDGVRQVRDQLHPLELAVERRDGRWSARARLAIALLPPGPLRVNAYAIHGEGAQRRYLCHTPLPGPRPDFHQPDRFAALLGR